MSKMTVTTEGGNQIVVTRQFAATPEELFQAHIDPEIVKQWCLGPDGWSMPVCIIEPKVGGNIRYEWSNADGAGFYMTGEFVEIERPGKIVHTERMFLPFQTPDVLVTTIFEAFEGGTRMTMTMDPPDVETQQAMIASGMTDGMEISYVRLESMIGK